MSSRSLINLFRNKSQLQGILTARSGGHGWDRPDVPLIIPYKHRRIINIFDVNLWFYCGVMPEYFINQNEAYLVNALGGIKQAALDLKWFALALFGAYITTQWLMNSRNYGIFPDSANSYHNKYFPELIKERPALKIKHFVGFKTSPENGVVHLDSLAKEGQLQRREFYLNQLKTVQQTNQELKNYIQKVESDSRKKVSLRNSSHKSQEHDQQHSEKHH